MRTRSIALATLAWFLISLIVAGAANAATEPDDEGFEEETAEEEPSTTVVGNLRDTRDEGDAPIEGVLVTAYDSDDNIIGEGTSDGEGRLEFPIDVDPGDGVVVTFEVDMDTVPIGVTISEEDAVQERMVNVNRIGINLSVSDPPDGPPSFAEQFLNGATSGIKFGLIIGMAALGLSMIFGTTGLTNFAHGDLITFGAVATFFFNQGLGLSVIQAGFCAVLLSAFFGWAQERTLWRPLRRRKTGLIAMMIVTIGMSIVLRYLFQYLFGGSRRPLSEYVQQSRIEIGPLAVTPKDIAIVVLALVAITVVCLALAYTPLGKATRAVADNPSLAASSGLRVDGVIAVVWTVGVGLTGLAGFALAVDQQVHFRMGFNLLLLVFAAVCLGGLGTVWGALLGSLIIGLVVELSPTFGVPAELKQVGALVVLIVILLVRPQGILGRRERIG